MEITKRLKSVLDYSRLSVRALAIKCGLKQQTLDKHIKGISEVSANTLMAIARTYPEISTEWLLLGTGEMLRKNDENLDRLTAMLDTVTLLQQTIKSKDEAIKALMKRVEELEAKH